MFKNIKNKFKGLADRAKKATRAVKIAALGLFLSVASPAVTFAQNAAGDYTAGTTALSTVAEENAFGLNHTRAKYD